jgi:multidrug efflux system outer membrane protein
MKREREGMRDTGYESRDTGCEMRALNPGSRIPHPASRSVTARLYIMVVVTGVAFLLQGCMMGPDYKRPETPQADSWRVSPATSESMANLPWWELLKDETLQQLIRTALMENLDLQIATANIDQFQAQLTISKFDLVPSFSYQGTAFGFRNTNTSSFPAGGGAVSTSQKNGLSLNYESIGVGLKWELDVWGRIRRSIEAARAQLLSKQENQRVVILSLVSGVAESYFDLRALDLQIDIAKRTLKAWDESVRISKLRYQQGDIPKLDLDRFVAERAGAAAQLADLERQVVQRENQISVLLGHKPSAVPRGRLLIEQPMPPDVPPGLPSELLERRPDIMKAEQDLVAASANIGVAQAARFPQLSITGDMAGNSLTVDSNSTKPYATFKGNASLAGPIFNASALGYQVKAAEAQGNQAIAQYLKTILQAFQEVEDSLISVQKTREQREALEQQVEALQSALRLADLRYQGGRANYLDVLTAQRDLFNAELSLARTRRNQLVSVVQLYKALGGGWSPGPAAPGQATNGIRGESAKPVESQRVRTVDR